MDGAKNEQFSEKGRVEQWVAPISREDARPDWKRGGAGRRQRAKLNRSAFPWRSVRRSPHHYACLFGRPGLEIPTSISPPPVFSLAVRPAGSGARMVFCLLIEALHGEQPVYLSGSFLPTPAHRRCRRLVRPPPRPWMRCHCRHSLYKFPTHTVPVSNVPQRPPGACSARRRQYPSCP